MNDYEATFQQFQLEAQTFGAQTRIPASVVASMKFEEVRDLMRDDLIHSVRGFIYGQSRKGETITRTAQVRTPDGWWQHFKECAIRDGNPFFDPAKVRYRYRTATLTVDPAEFRWWPYADLPVPEHWGAPIRLALPPQISWKVSAASTAPPPRPLLSVLPP